MKRGINRLNRIKNIYIGMIIMSLFVIYSPILYMIFITKTFDIYSIITIIIGILLMIISFIRFMTISIELDKMEVRDG